MLDILWHISSSKSGKSNQILWGRKRLGLFPYFWEVFYNAGNAFRKFLQCKRRITMKKDLTPKLIRIILAAVMVILISSSTVQPTLAGATRIPIINFFISCEEVSVEEVKTVDGVKYISGRYLTAEVRSSHDYHRGPAINISNVTVEMDTKMATFSGRVEMDPTAWVAGGWQGTYTIEGVPGDQTGVAHLRGFGDLEGYITKLTAKHVSGPTLHGLFPDACGGNVPIGGSMAEGYILVPEPLTEF
jgi:hypothetical protein